MGNLHIAFLSGLFAPPLETEERAGANAYILKDDEVKWDVSYMRWIEGKIELLLSLLQNEKKIDKFCKTQI